MPDFVKVVGFVDKSQPEGKEKISQLFSEAHFLLLPSQAECYGHVFCEANSFGIPCLTTNVGGIPTIVKTNINGKTFPINTDISNYCNYIIPLMSDYKKYQELAFRAFEEYKKRLNWSVAAQAAKELFLELL
ncbi:MAG: glycosyltransferase [Spirulinaceae cyanobacterium]